LAQGSAETGLLADELPSAPKRLINFNSVSSLNPAFWAREAQRSLFVENSALAIARTELRNLVAGEGDTVNRTIVSYPARATYTPGSDITATVVNGSKESLSISTWSASMVTIDDTEKRQSIIDLGTNISNKMMKNHNNAIEQAVMAEVTNAQWTLDDGNVGGTTGNNATVNTNTVPLFFTAADTKLDAIDAPKEGRTALVGTHFLNQLKIQQAGRPGSPVADRMNLQGYYTTLFGWDIVYTNNLPYTATFTVAGTPTDGDKVVIAGVTFTFKTVLGTTPGNILINGGNGSCTNLVNALNALATTTSNYIAVSDENVFLLRDKRAIAAVDNTGNLTLTGYGDIVVSASMTNASSVWSAQRQDALFGVKGRCIDLIVQIPPKVEVLRNPKQFGDIVKSMMGYGKKTFADGAREMVRVKINAGTSDWS